MTYEAADAQRILEIYDNKFYVFYQKEMAEIE